MSDKKNIILVIEDEPQIRKLLSITLQTENFKVVEASSGGEGTRMSMGAHKPQLVILDLGLPDIDGKEVITAIRAWSQSLPIIVLSVRDDDSEIATALNMGADDYVTKPFSPDILLARINANLRKAAREESGGDTVLVNGFIKMDLVRHEVFLHEEKVAFTPKEYELLRYLLVNRGKMLTHQMILKDVWGPAHANDMQYLRVYISQVREKIEENASEPKIIVTEAGIGYRMEPL